MALWRWLRLHDTQFALLWAGVVGLLGAAFCIGFRQAARTLNWLLTQHRSGELVEAALALPFWLRVAVPTAGGLLAGIILLVGARLLKRTRSIDYMEAITLGDGVVRGRATLVKAASALLTIASGGSIGREGPMVQLAAMCGSLVARWRSLPVPRRRLFVACGAAAGIASAYNAPIAGALFVSEIVLGSIAMESFGPLVVASVVAALATRYAQGSGPVYHPPPFVLVSVTELGAYLGLGLLAGVGAPLFLAILRGAERMFVRAVETRWLRMGVGGLVVGLISVHTPAVWGNGYSVVNSLLRENWAWSAVALLLLWKVTATASTVGSGAVGGVFTPTLFVGAAIGTMVGLPVHHAWPSATAPAQAYALVGMGAFLAATTHAPLTAVLIVFEMTLDYGTVLPLALACVVAYYTASSMDQRSLYSGRLKARGPRDAPPPRRVRVADLMHGERILVPETAVLSEVAEIFARSQQLYLFVVNEAGRFAGAIPLQSFSRVLRDGSLRAAAGPAGIIDKSYPMVTPETAIDELVARFVDHRGNRLAVVDDLETRRLLGCVSKADVLLALAHGIDDPRRGDYGPS